MAMYDNLLANVPTDLWIGGQWRKASDGARFDVIDPATENKIASVASARMVASLPGRRIFAVPSVSTISPSGTSPLVA